MNIYQQHGFHNREDYLESLSELYHAPQGTVEFLAKLYGPSEDFDGLIVALEEYDEVLGRL
jgi:hypothetical protein